MVDAPSNLLSFAIFLKFLIVARTIPLASIPWVVKKFLSSADKNALIIFLELNRKV